jgi:hypothetical protein
MKERQIKERAEDRRMQRSIRSRANYSLAVLGKSFVTNGSGRFLNLRTVGDTQSLRVATR